MKTLLTQLAYKSSTVWSNHRASHFQFGEKEEEKHNTLPNIITSTSKKVKEKNIQEHKIYLRFPSLIFFRFFFTSKGKCLSKQNFETCPSMGWGLRSEEEIFVSTA